MKSIFTIIIILFGLTACSSYQAQVVIERPTAEKPQADLPNPASVYCQQNGYRSEIRTAADGSQSGVCIFPDGSTCDEWAYFRGACSPAPVIKPGPVKTVVATQSAGEGGSGGYIPSGTTEPISDWWGVIKSAGKGAQFDDYFERQDLGQVIVFGIDSRIPEVQKKIEALRDSGKIVHLYGSLVSNVPDANGSQILVERIEIGK